MTTLASSSRIRPFAGRAKGLLALAALLAGVPAFAQSAAITASSPATLNQGNLRQATVSVTLTSATYESSADASHFTLTTAVPGLTVHGVAFNSGRTVATLRLHYDGSDFDAAATIAVTVAAAGTSHNGALTTSTQAVSPARWVNVSKKTVALAEGGGAGSYTVALESPPSGDVTVTVTSDNAAVTVGGAASTTLTFTTTNWATAQTVSVAPVDDNADGHDELALVTNVATGGSYASTAVANRTVRVTVADDEQTGTDYDDDDDQLIEIDSLAKLNAVRWDLDGNGVPVTSATSSYAAAFPLAADGMGCPDSGDADALGNCAGYELTADLDFDTNGDGTVDASDAYPNWAPIGGEYNATFHGNNRTISNLTTRGGGERGLFWGLGGSSRVSNLGLVDVAVLSTSGPSAARRGVGALAGFTDGTVEAVYVRGGAVSASYSGGARGALVGGLVGAHNLGVIRACYATAAVSGRSNLSPAVGGLVGSTQAEIVASYAAGAVRVHALSGTGEVGGLVGEASTRYSVFTNSYARGAVSATGSAYQGGLIGRAYNYVSAPASYWDSQTTGQSSSARGTTQTTYGLQTPTAYGAGATDIYAYWDDYDTDGDGRIDADDDAWHFGLANQYPSLKWGGLDPAEQFAAAPVDYDDDNDNLVDIRNLAQLDAMRHDLDGNGAPGATAHGAYFAAFPNAIAGMGCAAACAGYELRNDLDFDTDGDDDVDADDDYPNWTPIPVYSPNLAAPSFQTTFRGNGHVIDKLTVRRPTTPPGNTVTRGAGLFGVVGASGRIESLGVVDASVEAAGGDHAGIIVAELRGGRIVACYSTGSVSAVDYVGGLVGRTYSQGAKDRARIVASYSTATVSADSRGWQPGAGNAAGLVGRHLNGVILASYAAGPVSSQADPRYSGTPGGQGLSSGVFTLVPHFVGAVRDSYWDTEVTGQTTTYATSQAGDGGDAGTGVATMTGGQTTAALKSPTDYTGIYASWNIDLDGDDAPDDPWNFGASSEYPSLKWGGHDPTRQFAILPPPDEAAPANRPPEAASALSAATLAMGERRRVNLAAAFRDPDGDALAYSAASSNPAVAAASVEDAALVLQGVADGVATVTVTATDPEGLSISQTLTATVGTVLSVVGGDAPATGTPLVPAGALSVPEGATLRLDVRLSMPRREPTAFSWRILADADPATADADAGEYGDASGTATIAAGATSTEIAIAIADDADVEPAREWFVVELTSDVVALARSRLSAAVLEGVCDRSAAVASALAGRRGCTAPTVAELAARRTLGLDGRGIAALGADDLAGLSGLRWLSLRRNALETLPAGLLWPAPNLRSLLLERQPSGDSARGRVRRRRQAARSGPVGQRVGGTAGRPACGALGPAQAAAGRQRAGDAAGRPVHWRRIAALGVSGGQSRRPVRPARGTEAHGRGGEREPGPATIRAELATGAPFAVEVGLAADNAELAAADGSAFEDGAASLAAGGTFGGSVLATAAGSGAARVSATVGGMPETICDGAPCWTGLELSAGASAAAVPGAATSAAAANARAAVRRRSAPAATVADRRRRFARAALAGVVVRSFGGDGEHPQRRAGGGAGTGRGGRGWRSRLRRWTRTACRRRCASQCGWSSTRRRASAPAGAPCWASCRRTPPNRRARAVPATALRCAPKKARFRCHLPRQTASHDSPEKPQGSADRGGRVRGRLARQSVVETWTLEGLAAFALSRTISIHLPPVSADVAAQHRHGEGVPTVAVLEHDPLRCQRSQHLVDVAAAEWSARGVSRLFDHFLHGELVVVLEFGDDGEQFALPAGRGA